ncbi:hypothetical protein [Blastococcus atacamensis]|uniref:hypothetical protein n=1 Tax=Blastococcus atacamensis TaxID=2070508 RepID=UPI000CECC76B|nr:hypothetical protein [Blastococcus atacamensis]
MTQLPPDPAPPGADRSPRTPRWVMVLGLLTLVVLLLVLGLHLAGSGAGPGSHLGSATTRLLWP